ncbi:MAG: NAD(P)H-dependent oxidoreductase [Desulfobacterales bacterium]
MSACSRKTNVYWKTASTRLHWAIRQADALIVSVPTYFLGPNASLKRFIDRALRSIPMPKPCEENCLVGVGIAGFRDGEATPCWALSFLKLLMARHQRSAHDLRCAAG